MAFVAKTWKDRISEYPNRRTIDDGYTIKTVTVGRDEGTVAEAGTPFNATEMNDLESRIEDAINNGGGGGAYIAGENISIVDDTINVTDFMTANDVHTLWNS